MFALAASAISTVRVRALSPLHARALSPTLRWRALAVVLILAGAAGKATSGGTEPGRGTLVRGEGSFERSGEREGGNAGEESVGKDARVGLRQQVVRRTLRAGNGERGETWRSSDSVEAPPVIATNSTSLSYPAHPYHLSHPPRLSHSSRLSHLSHLSYPSDGAVAWSAVTHDAPLVVAAPPLPSDGVGRQLQQANNLPPECRDGSAMAAVALGTHIHDYLFPASSPLPVRPFELSIFSSSHFSSSLLSSSLLSSSLLSSSHLPHSLFPVQVTLTNKCEQRAIAQLSITIAGETIFYLLMPRLLLAHWDSKMDVHTFKVSVVDAPQPPLLALPVEWIGVQDGCL
ncbi:unnamed protein product [Closterium sp. Naga37s-1]|nr:unnamed protein product [Closterium sp. Naga37s-1]